MESPAATVADFAALVAPRWHTMSPELRASAKTKPLSVTVVFQPTLSAEGLPGSKPGNSLPLMLIDTTWPWADTRAGAAARAASRREVGVLKEGMLMFVIGILVGFLCG